MLGYILLGSLLLVAVLFISLVQATRGTTLRGREELLTSDVVDDDTDDPYLENDWHDIAYNDNDFAEDDYNREIEMFDDML